MKYICMFVSEYESFRKQDDEKLGKIIMSSVFI